MRRASLLPAFCWLLCVIARAQVTVPAGYQSADSLFRSGTYGAAQLLFSTLLRTEKNDSLYAEILHRKGVMFFATGDSDSAIYFEARALDRFASLQVRAKMSNVAGNLALIYASKKIYDKSLYYNLASIRDARKAADSLRQYFNLFTLYQVQRKYDSAFGILNNNILPFKPALLPNQAFLTALNFGLYYSNVARHDSAIYYFKYSLAGALATADSIAAYNNISDEYRLVKNYHKAISYIDSALVLTTASDNLEGRLSCYDTYVSLYTDIHDYGHALSYAQLARSLSDTLFTDGKANALLDAGVKYEAEKKEAHIQLLDKDNLLKQRNLTYSLLGLLLLSIVAILIVRNNWQKKKANATLIKQKAALEALTVELDKANQTKVLLLSTIGHDLRSPASSLYALLKMQELRNEPPAGNAPVNSSQVTGLLNVLENLLAWSKMHMVHSAIQPVYHPVDIHELYEDQLSFFAAKALAKPVVLKNNAANGLFFTTDEYILSTILRNLVDNAIAYSAREEEIIFDAFIENNNIAHCVIWNKSPESAAEQLRQQLIRAEVKTGSHGLGLVLVKQFCQYINGTIRVEYSDGFTVVSLRFPNAGELA